MNNPLAVATDGYLHGVLATATNGYIITAVLQVKSGATGGATRTVRARSFEHLERLKRDDEEIISIVIAAMKTGIL